MAMAMDGRVYVLRYRVDDVNDVNDVAIRYDVNNVNDSQSTMSMSTHLASFASRISHRAVRYNDTPSASHAVHHRDDDQAIDSMGFTTGVGRCRDFTTQQDR
jgi:hypothetical protein